MSATEISEPHGILAWYRRWWAKARTSFFWMVLIALVLRLGYIVIAHTYQFKTLDDNFGFGFEMGRIGRSLALGQGFSSPFSGNTGPTAWEPPLYPFLIASVFKIFGIYTRASALVLLSVNSIFSALICIPIFLIARRCFGEKVAVWSSWAWALLPPVIFASTRYVWETSLAALLMAVIFWLTLVLEDKDALTPWFMFGYLWGLAALTNTSLLAFLPVSGLWAWYRRAKLGKRSLTGLLLASAVFAACVAPWIVRNYRVFGQFIFIRSNFGAELRLGNGPGADGTWMDYLHATKNPQQLQLYRQMGELAYVAERKRQSIAFIRQDYARFAVLCLRRFIYFWASPPRSASSALAPFTNPLYLASSVLALWGLGWALRQHRPRARLFFWLVLTYPLIYYLVFVLPRYRQPIEPELLILMVYIISEAEPRRP
ncbi:MAG TPA: glycosyltransferase family 39 protein [Terriglobales bacterium]|nr:glycosyltransferase family 39 protein [Terriglobales bacterium]